MNPGTRLGPYEISDKLGEGGMGEVYRATDTRLGREVAIKVLPESVAQDPERLARFEREAKILASLNHPNIATIHGIEEGGSAPALVMELVEGPTLADRLAQGPIGLEEALPIARQIAEGLEYAHERGIIHRDLKPANIKLTSEDHVKILDFGLAKALEPESAASGSVDVSHSPTLTYQATVQGLILGTASYMSPEQAAGKPVDKRSDIWSFGVVLYEMLSGDRLFEGETVAETMADVLRREIDLARLPTGTPASIRQLLRRCLERNPKNRLHDIADARIVLDDVASGRAEKEAPAVGPASPRSRLHWLPWGLVGILALVVIGLLTWGPLHGEGESTPPVIRSVLPLPGDVAIELDPGFAGMPAISPDGKHVAFGAHKGSGPLQIWVQDLATGESRPLPGTEGGSRPFWSPDSRKVGFFTSVHLAVTPAVGGAITVLAPASSGRGASWSPSGTILFAPSVLGPLRAVSDRGGEERTVTGTVEQVGLTTHRFPQFLPDGEHFIYLVRAFGVRNEAHGADGLYVGRLGSDKPAERILQRLTNAVYASGYLLYVRDGTLIAEPFDPNSLTLSGDPTVLINDLLVNQRYTYGVFSTSRAGILAFQSGKQKGLSQLVWRDPSGRRLGDLGTPGDLTGSGSSIALSADGHWAAASRVDSSTGDGDIWLYDLERGTESRLSRPTTDDYNPVFSSDGKAVYFCASARDGGLAVIRRDLASGREETLLSKNDPQIMRFGLSSVSPNGEWLVTDQTPTTLASDVIAFSLVDSEPAMTVVASSADDHEGQVSPDGRWLLWASSETGRYEIYVMPFPEGGAKIQVSRNGGTQPRWNPAGGEIFYKTPDDMLTAVPVDSASGTFTVGTPTPLFPIRESFGLHYAVSSNGKRFLVAEPLPESDASPVTLLTGWSSLASQP
jgi:Tol biopolymer transport system component